MSRLAGRTAEGEAVLREASSRGTTPREADGLETGADRDLRRGGGPDLQVGATRVPGAEVRDAEEEDAAGAGRAEGDDLDKIMML